MEFRWGIISTGAIASYFVKDLLVDPKTRHVIDVVHKVVAVGSRDPRKAQEFIDTVAGGDKDIKAGTYEDVYANEQVDVVYIGTPHTYHYSNALDALKAGKHVLCEKPVTCNAAELRSLLDIAAERGLFFMEALWTRFQPLALEVKRLIDSGVLGAPVLLHADLSINFHINSIPKTHRILDPALGGGALLDLGPYPLFWAALVLYESPANKRAKPSTVTGSMLKTRLTGVDSTTTFTLTFGERDGAPSTLSAQAVLSCSIVLPSNDPGVTIRCERGIIEIAPPIYCPKSYKVTYINEGKVLPEQTKMFEYVGRGYHFQADEVARCVRLGKKESPLWSHDHSVLQMEIFDEVRRQGDYKFPEGAEKIL